jgi:hypothetical protein
MLATFALEESRCLGQPVAVQQIQQIDRIHHDDGFNRAS